MLQKVEVCKAIDIAVRHSNYLTLLNGAEKPNIHQLLVGSSINSPSMLFGCNRIAASR